MKPKNHSTEEPCAQRELFHAMIRRDFPASSAEKIISDTDAEISNISAYPPARCYVAAGYTFNRCFKYPGIEEGSALEALIVGVWPYQLKLSLEGNDPTAKRILEYVEPRMPLYRPRIHRTRQDVLTEFEAAIKPFAFSSLEALGKRFGVTTRETARQILEKHGLPTKISNLSTKATVKYLREHGHGLTFEVVCSKIPSWTVAQVEGFLDRHDLALSDRPNLTHSQSKDLQTVEIKRATTGTASMYKLEHLTKEGVYNDQAAPRTPHKNSGKHPMTWMKNVYLMDFPKKPQAALPPASHSQR